MAQHFMVTAAKNSSEAISEAILANGSIPRVGAAIGEIHTLVRLINTTSIALKNACRMYEHYSSAERQSDD